MKSLAIVFAMLVIAFTTSVFPQKKENLRHGQIFTKDNMMEFERGLRPHLPGNRDEELFQNKRLKKNQPLKIGDKEISVQTADGATPTERELATIKSVLTDDFLVNDNLETSYRYYPSIAMDGNGNFVIAWEDGRNGNYDIYYQRYNSSGNAQGVNTKVNDDVGTASQYSTCIAVDGGGNFVIAWRDGRNGNYDIYYQRYNTSGIAQGVNTKVNDVVETAYQEYPSLGMDGSGNFVIVWDDNRNGNYDIYYQRYNSSGNAQGVNTKVNDDVGTATQGTPSVTMDGSGNFVIVWFDNRNSNYGDVYCQMYNSDGTVQGVNTKINDDVGTAQQAFPSISMDATGNFVIAWEDNRHGNWDIYFQRYDSSGTVQGVNTKVNDDVGTAWQYYPRIAMDGNGNFVIVWEDYRYGSTNPDVIGQRYHANGTAWGANYRIVADGPNHVEESPVVVANASQIVFSWKDTRRSNGYDIYAKTVGWDWEGVTSVLSAVEAPTVYMLKQNYPNPFNPQTKISFSVPKESYITLKVYDLLGREVATFLQEKKGAGEYTVTWDAEGVPSGVYFYRLEAGKFIETKKLVLLK